MKREEPEERKTFCGQKRSYVKSDCSKAMNEDHKSRRDESEEGAPDEDIVQSQEEELHESGVQEIGWQGEGQKGVMVRQSDEIIKVKDESFEQSSASLRDVPGAASYF
jgi:hypothetical protein